MKTTAAIALALSRYAFALNEAPMITAAARLAPRDTDPLLVGYISENGGCKQEAPPPQKKTPVLYPTALHELRRVPAYNTPTPNKPPFALP